MDGYFDTPNSLAVLVAMAMVLGIRHGFDLDHLAAIDGMTQVVKKDAGFSRKVGFLFSLGHGLVVIALCLVMGSGAMHALAPVWLEPFGHWVSIFFLCVFGLLTFLNLMPNLSVVPTSLQGLIFKKCFSKTHHPLSIMLVGALFALSFDTVSQVVLFSLSVSTVLTGLLGVSFMVGMMLSDGLNGLMVSKAIQWAQKKSAIFSRGIGLVIALFSFMLACVKAL